MKKRTDEAIDLDEILLRQVEVRRNPSGSVLGSVPVSAPGPASQPAEREEANLPEVENEVPGSRIPKKNAGLSGYESLFLKKNIVQQRSAIYISEQTKAKLTEVVRCLCRSNISLTTYVENILSHHLELFKDEINRLHRQKNTKNVL